MHLLANGGREARDAAARRLETEVMASLGHNQDGDRSRTSTAGLTAPVRPFILGIATDPAVVLRMTAITLSINP
jgi:hypothetical protein